MNKPKLSKEAKAWILYDGGNSAFATTVIAAFFPIFFNDFWASGLEAEVKTAYLGWGLTISNLVLLFPLLLLEQSRMFQKQPNCYLPALRLLQFFQLRFSISYPQVPGCKH